MNSIAGELGVSLLGNLNSFDVPPSKIIQVYRFPQHMVIHDHIYTRMGLVIAAAPYLTIPIPTSPEDIGKKIWNMMSFYHPERDDIEHPIDWQEWWSRHFEGLGIHNIQELYEKTLCVRLELYGNHIQLTPSQNHGSHGYRRGFQYLTGQDFSVPLPTSLARIGMALNHCFAQCTSIHLSRNTI
jgi:hypothetical protein